MEKEEVANFIRGQRLKVKYKFTIDDFGLMPFNWAKRLGFGDLPLLKLMKKRIDRDFPGPLMEKKVFQNEAIMYYSKRYCPCKEKRGPGVTSQLMNFHPSSDLESLSFHNRNDTIIGLKLDPPELKRIPPRRLIHAHNTNTSYITQELLNSRNINKNINESKDMHDELKANISDLHIELPFAH